MEKQTNKKISVRLRCRHGTVDFIDPQKTDIPKLTCGVGCGMSLFVGNLFPAQPSSYSVILMAYCKTAAAPVCYQWSYGSPAPSH